LLEVICLASVELYYFRSAFMMAVFGGLLVGYAGYEPLSQFSLDFLPNL